MSFILVPKRGEDLQINAWNWRPTLEFLRSENIIDAETFEKLGTHGAGGHVDADLANCIGLAIQRKLEAMHPGERIRGDLSVTSEPKKMVQFADSSPIDAVDVYSAKYEWLVQFKDFCEHCGGFAVV